METDEQTLSVQSSTVERTTKLSPQSVIHFGCEQRSGVEQWDTSYFLSLLFELLDEFKEHSHDESRLAAFLLSRFNDTHFTTNIPLQLVLQILKYFRNVRLKILVLLELLNVCERLDCSQALMILWEFSSYGYMTLFYVLDRIKFSIVNKDHQWKSLLTIFEPLDNKKHAAYIVLDKSNFYKPNRATIKFGSKTFERYFWLLTTHNREEDWLAFSPPMTFVNRFFEAFDRVLLKEKLLFPPRKINNGNETFLFHRAATPVGYPRFSTRTGESWGVRVRMWVRMEISVLRLVSRANQNGAIWESMKLFLSAYFAPTKTVS